MKTEIHRTDEYALPTESPKYFSKREIRICMCIYIYLTCVYTCTWHINTHRWHKKNHTLTHPSLGQGFQGSFPHLQPHLHSLLCVCSSLGLDRSLPLQKHSLQGESVTVVYRVLSHMLLPVMTPKATFPYSRARTHQHPLQHPSNSHVPVCAPHRGAGWEGEKQLCSTSKALLPEASNLWGPSVSTTEFAALPEHTQRTGSWWMFEGVLRRAKVGVSSRTSDPGLATPAQLGWELSCMWHFNWNVLNFKEK